MGPVAQIEKVFGAACHKKVWDHFTKAQRKNIDLWKKQSTGIHVSHDREFVRDADEMDLSDEDSDHYGRYTKRTRLSLRDGDSNSINNNKTMLDLNSDVKDQQLKVLQETIRNLQTQLLDNKTKEKENQQKFYDLEMRLKRANVKELLLKTKIVEATKTANSASNSTLCVDVNDSDNDEIVCLDDDEPEEIVDVSSLQTDSSNAPQTVNDDDSSNTIGERLNTDEAHIICLVSAYLVVHPFGTSLDNILSYIKRTLGIQYPLESTQLNEMLRQYANIFREVKTNCDSSPSSSPSSAAAAATAAGVECIWKFCGFDRAIDTNISPLTSKASTEEQLLL